MKIHWVSERKYKQMELHKTKEFLHLKRNDIFTEWERIFTQNPSDNVLISMIHRSLVDLYLFLFYLKLFSSFTVSYWENLCLDYKSILCSKFRNLKGSMVLWSLWSCCFMILWPLPGAQCLHTEARKHPEHSQVWLQLSVEVQNYKTILCNLTIKIFTSAILDWKNMLRVQFWNKARWTLWTMYFATKILWLVKYLLFGSLFTMFGLLHNAL